jgi:hypothetical protein
VDSHTLILIIVVLLVLGAFGGFGRRRIGGRRWWR